MIKRFEIFKKISNPDGEEEWEDGVDFQKGDILVCVDDHLSDLVLGKEYEFLRYVTTPINGNKYVTIKKNGRFGTLLGYRQDRFQLKKKLNEDISDINFFLFESLETKKFNDILKLMGVMNQNGSVDLKNMTNKINDFLDKDKNRDKFLKKVEDDIEPKVDVENVKIKAKKLKPSQNEIFLDRVIERLAENKKDRKDILKGYLKDQDILISDDSHIIDGHHRWACAYILNPDCEINVTKIDMPIKYALPLLNAILSANDEVDEISHDGYSIDIFKIKNLSDESIYKRINSIVSDQKKGKKIYKNMKKKLEIETPLKEIIKNVKSIPTPKRIFEDRDGMPRIKEKDAKKLL